MPNDLTGNPFILDTAGGGVIFNDYIRIKHLRWVDAGAAGNHCSIQDAAGREIWRGVASGANFEEDSLSENLRFFKGLNLATLDSGKVFVYYH